MTPHEAGLGYYTMVEVIAIIALAIAGVALLVAAGQFTQQVMATAYMIRKCDGIVTGGVIRGGSRHWHWQQFRFTVTYQAIIFALPSSVYKALHVSPSVQIDGHKPNGELVVRARKLRPGRNLMQGCWISFIQDLIMSDCISEELIDVREESGDRIPNGLTVAPMRVDGITVMLVCIAMGMRVYQFSPIGEITLSGGIGSISFSKHPVLGALLHYSNFLDQPIAGFGIARLHGRALYQENGIWANTVFGRFRDRSYKPEFIKLRELIKVRTASWKDYPIGSIDSHEDTLDHVACFIIFADVDCSMPIPPSVVHPICKFYSELIVKAHHMDISTWVSAAKKAPPLPAEFHRRIELVARQYGYSSPWLPWHSLLTSEEPTKLQGRDALRYIRSERYLITCESLAKDLAIYADKPVREQRGLRERLLRGGNGTLSSACIDTACPPWYGLDPSSYTSINTAWQMILQADQCMQWIYETESGSISIDELREISYCIMKSMIASLPRHEPASWNDVGKYLSAWRKIFYKASKPVLRKKEIPLSQDKWISIYTRLRILRAAYYTIMMRAAGDAGPGLTLDTSIDTVLAFMA